MSLVSRIKGERTLTFNHWRYRLLHWTYGVQPESPAESPLPHFLYSHYCPLFHLTNIFVLTAPFVFLWRHVARPLFVGFLGQTLIAPVAVFVGGVIVAAIRALARIEVTLPTIPESEERRNSRIRAGLIDKMNKLICESATGSYRTDFDYFWRVRGNEFSFFSREEAEIIWEHLVSEYEIQEAIKKRRKARIVAIINFAQMAAKVALALLAIAGIIGLGFLVKYGVPYLIGQLQVLFHWVGGLPWPYIGQIAGATCLILGGVFGLAVLATAMKLGTRIEQANTAVGEWFTPKLFFCLQCVAYPFVMIKRGAEGFADFCVEVYQNNCPPITIVDDREERLFIQYIDAVMNYLMGDEDSESAQVMARVERNCGNGGIPEQGVDDFRRAIAAYMGNLAHKNVEFTIDTHPELGQAVKKAVLRAPTDGLMTTPVVAG